MRKSDIVIIGGGAAGLMAACAAAQTIKKSGSVLVVEGNQKLGRKLLATGNGRCNLTNIGVSPERYHGDVKAAEPLLNVYTPEKIMAVFREMGLVTKADSEGRVYPHNLQAAAVLSVLRGCAEENGAACVIGSAAISVLKTKRGFLVKCTDGEEIEAAKCILACGGAASPKHSCSADGYTFAKDLGHTVTTLYPALTQLVCKGKLFKSLSGMRCAVNASLLADGRSVYAESGEVLFSDAGLSGICIFGLSVYAAEFFATGKINGRPYKTLSCALDCLPEWTFTEITDYLDEIRQSFPNRMAGDMLMGLMNMKIGYAMVQAAGIDPAQSVKFVTAGQIQKLAALIKAWKFEITGTKSWNDAQITAGGVPLSEIDPLTMESKKARGLYLAGEMLNIHGDCGGYNLHFAWATGIAAGKDAAEKVKR
ncbi:MAG: aminoacetone oxidase family FAD-binding enzyme [Clostridia bacterium]|nr:aminoacetone oxidase family FAD-binding enzyme [Clostridia bacterium]